MQTTFIEPFNGIRPANASLVLLISLTPFSLI